jgi:hypothetical protein
MEVRIHLPVGLVLAATPVASCGINKLADAIKQANHPPDLQGPVTISLTDAPADSATKAVLEFSGVELTPDSGSAGYQSSGRRPDSSPFLRS